MPLFRYSLKIRCIGSRYYIIIGRFCDSFFLDEYRLLRGLDISKSSLAHENVSIIVQTQG